MTNHPQILDGTLTIADDGTTWILTASERLALMADREAEGRRQADRWFAALFLAGVALTIVLLGALICAPLIAAVLL